MPDSRPLILISNDDGIGSSRIQALEEAVRDLGEIYVVAPEAERSAAAHSLTLHKPLRIYERSPRHFAVSGTPTDCVNLAVFTILPRKPDILLSGINHGANMADDVTIRGPYRRFDGRFWGSLPWPSLMLSENPDDPLALGTARHFPKTLSGAFWKTLLRRRSFFRSPSRTFPLERFRASG